MHLQPRCKIWNLMLNRHHVHVSPFTWKGKPQTPKRETITFPWKQYGYSIEGTIMMNILFFLMSFQPELVKTNLERYYLTWNSMGGDGKQYSQVLAQEQIPYIEDDALPPSAQTAWDTAVKPWGLWIRSLRRDNTHKGMSQNRGAITECPKPFFFN